MIIKETIEYCGSEHIRIYSDQNLPVIVDGVSYGELCLPADSQATIIEGEPDPDPELDSDEALEILLGGAV